MGSVFPIVVNEPIYRAQVGKTIYQNAYQSAELRHDSLSSADYDLTESIKNAALRGVDVRV